MDQETEYTNSQEHKSVSTLITEFNNKQINLDAPYQRGIIWAEKEQSAFINSVLKNIICNNIILNLDTSKDKYVCLDGKQRLTSLINFKRNKIPVRWGEEN